MTTNFYENTEQAVSYLPNADDVTTIEQLREIFLPLNETEKGSAEKALAYILTGEDDGIIKRFNNILDDMYAEKNDDRYRVNLEYHTRLYHFDNTLYKLGRGIFDKLNNAQLVRVGNLLASFIRLPHFAELDEMIPRWFIHFVEDVVILKKTSLSQLIDLLAFADVPNQNEIITQCILVNSENPRDKNGHHGFKFYDITKTKDFDEFYISNIQLFESYIPHLNEREQKHFFAEIIERRQKLFKPSHKIIATLCVSEYDEPRKLALEKISGYGLKQVQTTLLELYENGDNNKRMYVIEALVKVGQSSQSLIENLQKNESHAGFKEKIQHALDRLIYLSNASQYVKNNDVIKHIDTMFNMHDDNKRLRLVDYILTGNSTCTASLLVDEKACARVYDIIFQSLNTQQIIRLGKVLAIPKVGNIHRFEGTQTPKHFIHLIVHALNTTITYSYPKINRDNWTYAKMMDIIGSDEKTPAYFLVDMLLKGYIQTTPIDSVEFFNANQEAFEIVLPELSVAKQDDFFKRFLPNYPDFFETHTKLLALLCIADNKKIRELALAKLADISSEKTQPHLQTILKTGNAKQKALAVDALVTTGDKCLQILEQALTEEKTKSVQAKLEQAIQRLSMLQANKQEAYEIPEFVPLEITKIPDSFIEVMKQNAQEIYESHKCEYERLIEEDTCDYSIKQAKKKTKDWKAMAEGTDVYQFMLDKLNGKPAKLSAQGNNATGWKANDVWINDIVSYKNSIQKQSGYGLLQALIASDLRYGYSWRSLEPLLTKKMLETLELRQLYQVLQSLKLTREGIERDSLRDIASIYLCRKSDAFFTTEQLVPFFTTNLELLAEALGLAPLKHGYNFKFENALDVLTLFPQIPDQYIPKLLEVALGTQKKLRFECQEVLSKVPNIHLQAIDALKNSQAEIRITATDWLGRLGETQEQHRADIITALHALMKKEKKEAVTTAVLSALEKNGDDISVFLSPEVLLKEAQKGLKAKLSKTFTWFDERAIPKLSWQDGSEVDSQIIHWWIVLAEKLKEPKPNALFKRYLNLLDETSQQSLSLFVLQTFARQDLSLFSKAEAITVADTLAPQLHSDLGYYGCIFSDGYGIYDSWSKQYPDTPLVSVEIIHTHVVAQLQKTVKSSAIKSKGMLALVHKAVGTSAVDILTNYIKNHHRRTAQIGAFLDAFSASDDPLVIQWILNISRRYRTKSIQEKAMDIIAEIAKRNHWTQAQLGDRTIPMAGVDDDGILQLDYGTRTLTAYIDEKYKFVLQNEQGKVIKSLPAPRQEDDKKLIKETKSLFSACKKELKQMIELQTARLYEAMCCERLWAVAEWQEYLLAHPIMKRLIARLIWIEVDTDGTILQVFRPSEDGSLLNISDDEISLNPDSQIKLAHYVLLAATSHDVKQWKQHLKDYEIKALFEQLKNTVPQTNDDENSFTDFVDTQSEAFKLRSVITKLGYLRCGIGDGGGFDKYYKYYESLDISAVLVFSGSGVPEENINIQLGEFRFQKGRVHTWDREGIDFAEVPPILLAESYAEYGLIAKKV